MTEGIAGASPLLRRVRCACGGPLREVDAYAGPGAGASSLDHLAACNACGARFSAERALLAAMDAERTGGVVLLTRSAAA